MRPIERLSYRICGVDDTGEMNWRGYDFSMLLFSGVSLFLLYLMERTQQWLPWNPQKLPNVASSPSHLASTNQALVDRVKSDVTKLQQEIQA